MAMVRSDAPGGRRLGMSHRGRSTLTRNAIYPGVDRVKRLVRLCDTGDAMSARVTERSHSPDGRSRANQSPNDVQTKRDRVRENGSQDNCRASESRTKRRHDDGVQLKECETGRFLVARGEVDAAKFERQRTCRINQVQNAGIWLGTERNKRVERQSTTTGKGAKDWKRHE